MKKFFTFTVTLLIILFLSACNNNVSTNNPEIELEDKFIGKITKIENNTALISIEEGNILKSGNQVHVDLSVNEIEVFFVGDKVEVTFDGMIRESNPLSINTISVEKVQ